MDDFDLQLQLAQQRRQRFAQQLAGAQDAPQGKMVGNVYVPPNALQYAAQALRGIGAMRGEQMAGEEIAQLNQQRQQAMADTLRQFGQMSQGRPADVLPDDQQGPVRPAQAPDMRGAFGVLMSAPDERLRQAGVQGMIQLPQLEAQAADRAAQREWQQAQAEQARQDRIAAAQLAHQQRLDLLNAQNASREQMAEANRQFQREMAQLRASMPGASSQPYYQPVQTAQGVMAFNARTGRVEPVMVDGAPVIGAQADPNLQANITGAEVGARRAAEGAADARTEARKADMFLQQLDQAESILKSGPTASGVGALRDAVGRMIGVNTESADRAGQLEALSGWLVANVPRMEGPQSNFDVQNYMTMAGKIGDRTVPVSERLAALNEVRKLQQKYAGSAQQRVQNAPNFTARPSAPAPNQVLPAIPGMELRPIGPQAGGTQPAAPQGNRVLRFDAQGNIIR